MTLTTDDFLKIENIVADSKSDIIEEISKKISHLPTKDEFFSRMDKLSGEIKSAREEFAAHTKQHTDIHDQDERNEKRFKRLEKHVGLPLAQD